MKCPQCGENIETILKEVCSTCELANQRDNALIDEYIEKGHTEHCAKRMTWGDGECECHKRKES